MILACLVRNSLSKMAEMQLAKFMAMDVRLLETFRAVMDTQSMTGAARLLGLTQPAVSGQVARLEAYVGFPLFERVGGRLKGSVEGRRFFAEVRNALDTLDRLDQSAKNIRTGVAEGISVASHPSASTALLPQLVAELLKARADARVRMINRTSEEVRAIFEAGGVDIGIAEWPINLPGIDLRRYKVPMVAVLPTAHPLAGEQIIRPKGLSGMPFIAMPDARLIGHQIRNSFMEQSAEYTPVAESEYFSTICGLVAAGGGVSVVDIWSARTYEPLGLQVRRFEPAIEYEIGVFQREGRVSSPLADELIALIDRELTKADALRLRSTEDA